MDISSLQKQVGPLPPSHLHDSHSSRSCLASHSPQHEGFRSLCPRDLISFSSSMAWLGINIGLTYKPPFWQQIEKPDSRHTKKPTKPMTSKDRGTALSCLRFFFANSMIHQTSPPCLLRISCEVFRSSIH
jgi:hypothetical protein